MSEKEGKVIIVAGEMFAHRVFAEYLRGIEDYKELVHDMARVDLIGKVDDSADYEDEELRLALDRFVSLGKSVLIVGGYRSGKTTLMKRLIRQKAATETGLAVIDGVTPEYVGEASKELQERGLTVREDVNILATLTGNNANFGLAQFVQYWNKYNSPESLTEVTSPIDIVTLMDNGKVVGLFEVSKYGGNDAVLEPLNETETKVDIYQNTVRDKTVDVVKDLIDNGNRVMLITDDDIPAEKAAVVRMLTHELSKTRNVTMYGTAAAYDKAIKDSNIVTAYGHGYEIADWEEFQTRLADKNKPIDFLLSDRGCEYGFYETINHLAKGNPGCIVDGYVRVVENHGDLSFYASRYMTGAKEAGEVNYTMTDIFDDSELNNKVLTSKMYPAIDKVVTVTKKGVITLYSVDKTGGYALIKE
ncbi:ATP-binding protein [Bacillus cereus group sp. MYBK15-3]|uniref:ATP-binding protein n=1 Tax=unclassified Bacillus cereus group TaxID=2750818 RepID=UPI003F7A794F